MQIEVNKKNGVQVCLFWPHDTITGEQLRAFVRPYIAANSNTILDPVIQIARPDSTRGN